MSSPLAPSEPARTGHESLHYRRLIGAGAMGEVFLAELRGPEGFEKLVAVKRLHRHVLLARPEVRARFVREARVSAMLEHPNIVPTHRFFEEGGTLHLVMAFVKGQNLGALLGDAQQTGRAIPCSVSLQIVAQVLDGLHYAHAARDAAGRPMHIVHRDIKPSNIILDENAGLARILDFGVARSSVGGGLTGYGEIVGTPDYMAPEQLAEDAGTRVDHRADLFSAGLVLFELLAGFPLYRAPNQGALLVKACVAETAEYLDELPESPVREDLQRFLRKALAKDPGQRYQSGEEMAEALREIERRVTPAVRLRKWLRSRALPVGEETGAGSSPDSAKNRTDEGVLPGPTMVKPAPRMGPHEEPPARSSPSVGDTPAREPAGRGVEEPGAWGADGQEMAPNAGTPHGRSEAVPLKLVGFQSLSGIGGEPGVGHPPQPVPVSEQGARGGVGPNAGGVRVPTRSGVGFFARRSRLLVMLATSLVVVALGVWAARQSRPLEVVSRTISPQSVGPFAVPWPGEDDGEATSGAGIEDRTQRTIPRPTPRPDLGPSGSAPSASASVPRSITHPAIVREPAKTRVAATRREDRQARAASPGEGPASKQAPHGVTEFSEGAAHTGELVVNVWLKVRPEPSAPGVHFVVAGQRVAWATKTSVRIPREDLYEVVVKGDSPVRSFSMYLAPGGKNKCVYFSENPAGGRLKCRTFE